MRWHRWCARAREASVAVTSDGSNWRARCSWRIRNHPAIPSAQAARNRRRRDLRVGVHHFDLVRFLLGSEGGRFTRRPEETKRLSSRADERGVQSRHGALEGTGENHEFEVYGERGWLRVSCNARTASNCSARTLSRRGRRAAARAGRALLTCQHVPASAAGGDYVSTTRACGTSRRSRQRRARRRTSRTAGAHWKSRSPRWSPCDEGGGQSWSAQTRIKGRGDTPSFDLSSSSSCPVSLW